MRDYIPFVRTIDLILRFECNMVQYGYLSFHFKYKAHYEFGNPFQATIMKHEFDGKIIETKG